METGLSLGANLGDRLAYLTEARKRIATIAGARLAAQSAVYETEPLGVKPEHRHLTFYNAVLILDVDLNVRRWHDELRKIENELGRRRLPDQYAPRPIDIDLIYFGSEPVDTGKLILPHPRCFERRFVLRPLVDVRPALVLPGQTRTVSQLLAELPPKPSVKWLTRDW